MKSVLKIIVYLLAYPLIICIKIYQSTISSLFGSKCRFTPSCSQYGIDALTKYGIFKGIWLTLNRVLKCNPFGGSGYDPVP